MSAGRTGAAGQDHGHHSQDKGHRGHHHRAEAQAGGGECRVDDVFAPGDLFLGKFDDQDSVLGGQSDEGYQSDLEVDVVFQPADSQP